MEGIESFEQDIHTDYLVDQVLETVEKYATKAPANECPGNPAYEPNEHAGCGIHADAGMKKAKVDGK